MQIKYILAANCEGVVDPDTLKVCDDGARAFGSAMRETAKIMGGRLFWLLILIQTFYWKRTVTKEAIIYDFPLIPDTKI